MTQPSQTQCWQHQVCHGDIEASSNLFLLSKVKLSKNWNPNSEHVDDAAAFVDQNPVLFVILLDCMQDDMIKVDDVNQALLVAQDIGIEKLSVAFSSPVVTPINNINKASMASAVTQHKTKLIVIVLSLNISEVVTPCGGEAD